MNRWLPLMGCLALTACASDLSMKGVGADAAAYAEIVDSESALRLDVFPSGGGDLLPQSFTVLPEDIDGIALELSPTVTVSGSVFGATPSPVDITIPSDDDLPVVARLSFQVPGTVMRASTTSTAAGRYSVDLPAGFGYRLVAVAEEPVELPLYIEENLAITEDTRIEPVLGLGAALGGVAEQSDGRPLPAGARLSLVDVLTGERGPLTEPEAGGAWLLRALPGEYDLLVDGRPGSAMPSLTQPVEVLDDDVFVEVDVVPGVVETGSVSGSLVDAGGRALDDVEVRFTATRLSGLPDGATSVVSTDTDRNGLFSRELARGDWLMEVIPPFERNAEASPAIYAITVDGPAVDLGATALMPRSRLDARVFIGGSPASGIVITAQEQGFNRYTYTDTSDEDGWIGLDVPDVPLEITMQSPDGSQPITRRSVEVPGAVDRLDLEDEGSLVRGTLYQPGGGPLAFGLVEIRNSAGVLLGSTLTNGAGEFNVTVGLIGLLEADTAL